MQKKIAYQKHITATAILIATAVSTFLLTDVFAQQSKEAKDVAVRVQIVWKDLSPVKDAVVFIQNGNRELGKTSDRGSIEFTVPDGTEIRVVDPLYGTTQLLHKVESSKNSQLLQKKDGKEFYVMAASWPI